MDQDRANELQRITDYFRENPTAKMPDFPDGTPQGGQHVHVHHHYAAPVIDTSPVQQNQGQSVLEKYTPYFMVFLGGMIILTGCALILFAFAAVLAMILLVVLAVVLATAILAMVIAHMMKTHSDSGINEDLLNAATRKKR